MATLNIINNFEITVQGVTYSGKQGASSDASTDPHELTVTGNVMGGSAVLATASVRTVWDEDDDEPNDILYWFYWCDVASYIQFVAQGTNVIFPVAAKTPFVLSGNTLLAAADTTIITGGTEPTLSAIDSVVIGNYSGGNGNYVFAAIE